VAAAIGVEGREQAMRADRLRKAAKARRRALLFDEEDRQYLARRVVHRHDQIELRPLRQPGVGRAVLEHQHPRQGTPLPLAPMRAAPRGLARQPARLQDALRPRVGARERAPVRHFRTLHGLVKMLGREIEIAGTELLADPFDLVHRRPKAGRPPTTPVDQSFRSPRLMGVAQAAKMTLAHPQKLRRLHATQPLRPMKR